jgi:hypothetical protein
MSPRHVYWPAVAWTDQRTLKGVGLKTQWSRCTHRPLEPWKYQEGFFAEQVQGVLEALPPHLWSDKRRKRSYLNHVLARAEVDSDYRPARRLWRRARHGRYVPNPALLLRRGEGWQPVYEALNLAWIDRGCGDATPYGVRPAQLLGQLGVVAKTPGPGSL